MSLGRLSVQWTYSETRHRRATVEGISRGSFLAALRALISRIACRPRRAATRPSDFQGEGPLTQGMIDMLAGLDDEA